MAHDTRITFSYLFLFSGFVRYAIQPKDDKILFLLSTALGKQTEPDKIKIIKGLKVESFGVRFSKHTTCRLIIFTRLHDSKPHLLTWQRADFVVAFYSSKSTRP